MFEALTDAGTVIVATSNRAPWDLNHFGVHEVIFDEFKRRLGEACSTINVSCPDFRRNVVRNNLILQHDTRQKSSRHPCLCAQTGQALGENFKFPLAAREEEALDCLWQKAVESEGFGSAEECVIPVMFGRHLKARTPHPTPAAPGHEALGL